MRDPLKDDSDTLLALAVLEDRDVVVPAHERGFVEQLQNIRTIMKAMETAGRFPRGAARSGTPA